MLAVLLATRTRPIRQKLLARTALTILLPHIMHLIRMLATTLKILRTSDWKINVISTFTTCSFTLGFIPTRFSQIIMPLVKMVAKTLGT
jgi:hypothetical protein